MKQEDAEHKSVKHVSKVEIKTFSDAVAERDSRNGRVNQKCTYTKFDRREKRESSAGLEFRGSRNVRHEFERTGSAIGFLRRTLQAGLPDILRRFDLEGESPAAVAQALQVTSNNLTVRLHPARRALRANLEQTCGLCTGHGCSNCTCDVYLLLPAV